MGCKYIVCIKIIRVVLGVLICCFSIIFAAKASVLEVVVFKSKSGVNSKQLFQSAQSITPILKAMPGFESRIIGHGEKKNEWIDIVCWHSLLQANTAAKRIVHYPAMKKFMSLMSGYSMRHFKILDNT